MHYLITSIWGVYIQSGYNPFFLNSTQLKTNYWSIDDIFFPSRDKK